MNFCNNFHLSSYLKNDFSSSTDSLENNIKEGGAMYISSSPNAAADGGYTPNNGTIFNPWIDSEAQVNFLLPKKKNLI